MSSHRPGQLISQIICFFADPPELAPPEWHAIPMPAGQPPESWASQECLVIVSSRGGNIAIEFRISQEYLVIVLAN